MIIRSTLSIFTCFLALQISAQDDGPFVVIDSGTEINLRSVHFPTPEVGYAGGDLITLLKTTDGGDTWSVVELTGVSSPGFADDPIIDLYFSDENNGFMIVEDFSAVYETSDGGLTWSSVEGPAGELCFPRDLERIGAERILLAGSACFAGNIVTIYDEGTWDESGNLLEEDDSEILDIAIFGSESAILSSTNGSVYLSSDAGMEWTKVDINPGSPITAVRNRSANEVYATSTNSTSPLYISTDGGSVWTPDESLLPDFDVSLNGVLTGTNTFIFGFNADNNLGFVGSVLDEETPVFQEFDSPLRAGHLIGGTSPILVGDNGIILKLDGVVSSTDPLALKKDFVPYPNPATELIKIEHLDFADGSHSYRLVNLVGQEAKADVLTSAGIPVSDMKSGIYFLEIFREGISVGIRKVIVQ